jgi:predicted RNase H-like HicB family nuclease
MSYGIVFERIREEGIAPQLWYAHVPSLGLTTHGEGIEGARAAALDLLALWVAEKRANNEDIPKPAEYFFSTVEIPENAIQGA